MTQFYSNDKNLSRQYFTTKFRKYLLECNDDFHYFRHELTKLQTKYQTSDSVNILYQMSNNLQNLNKSFRPDYTIDRYISDCSIPNFNDMVLLNELLKFVDVKDFLIDERLNLLERNIEELKTIVKEIRKISYETNGINLTQNVELSEIKEEVKQLSI